MQAYNPALLVHSLIIPIHKWKNSAKDIKFIIAQNLEWYRGTEIQRYRDTEIQRYRDTEITCMVFETAANVFFSSLKRFL